MKHVRALLEIVFFVMFCLVADVNSAQVNSADHNYRFGEVHERNAWHDGEDILTPQSLKVYLARLPGMNILRELARMLLAQIPAAGGVNYNVAENNDVAYVTLDRIADVYKSCGELKKHLLEHGHLGYFPVFSVIKENSQAKVNKFVPRGIFNIPFNIASRITNNQLTIANRILSQRYLSSNQTRSPIAFPYGYNITSDVIHLSPNILADTELPRMFKIDPESRGWPYYPNLNSVANGLINHLLSTNHVLNIVVGAVNRNRFTLDVKYNFPHPMPGVTQTKDIGYKMNGTVTNTVKIVVQVQNGKISIVTMYPI